LISSLLRPGGGVAVELRAGERAPVVLVGLARSEGVPGRLEGRARSPRELRRSFSDWEVLEVVPVARGFEGFGGRAVVLRVSNWARRSSALGPVFLLDIMYGSGRRRLLW
jgi:hypothetical protein